MKILITGSSGLVGKALVRELKKKHNILSPTHKELNLLNEKKTNEYIKIKKPNFVIHAAGKVGGILYNSNNQKDFFIENMKMGLNVLNACYNNNVYNVFNLASSCIYPKIFNRKISENKMLTGPLEETNEGYALAKISCLKLCAYMESAKPILRYKTIIPCNIFGTDDDFKTDNAHLLPSIIRKFEKIRVNQKNKLIHIWGSGKAKREFMHADYFAKIINFLINKIEYMPKLLNVGTGEDYTIYEYYKKVQRIYKLDVIYKYDLSKPEGMKRKLLDITRLKNLGWKKKHNLDYYIRYTIKNYEK